MSKPKKLGMPAAYTSNARADFLRRPKAAERRKWLSQAMIGWHVWSRNGWNGEKEDMNSDQKTRS